MNSHCVGESQILIAEFAENKSGAALLACLDRNYPEGRHHLDQ
jgi:hypothetical protein